MVDRPLQIINSRNFQIMKSNIRTEFKKSTLFCFCSFVEQFADGNESRHCFPQLKDFLLWIEFALKASD